MKPPEVIIATPIFHPNVNEKNRLCTHWFDSTASWDNKKTLTDVLNIIVDALDNPKPDDGAVNAEAAKMFRDNRAEFERKATATLEKNGIRRS